MDMSKRAYDILSDAIAIIREKKYEYLTPEVFLMAMCDDDEFCEVFDVCGGDCDELASDLTAFVEGHLDKNDGSGFEMSQGMQDMLVVAESTAISSGCGSVDLRHLLHGMWKNKESYAVYYMKAQGVREVDLLQEMAIYEEGDTEITGDDDDTDEDYDGMPEGDRDDEESFVSFGQEAFPTEENVPSERGRSSKSWQLYAPCLNDTADTANPLIGREAELERTIQILCRKDKNNPLHIGEPGVGKTAITYGLVRKINAGEVPEYLKGSRIYSLDLAGMLAGTQYRGDFEKRFKTVMSEIAKEEKPIVYLDEIHNLSGAGAVGEGSFDAANMLKGYLTNGHIRFIGATTFEEYKKYFERNKSLVRRFQNVEIGEPSQAETVEILKGLKSKYEEFHGVTYEDGVLEYAVEMSAKHINERFLPDKAIDLIDEAAAYRKLNPGENGSMVVDRDVIAHVLTEICRVPVETIDTEDLSGLASLEERLRSSIFGQDEAIGQVVNAIKFSKAGLLDENKPLASLLFVGPTGVGKTEIARCLARELGSRLIRFDMSEYGEKHAVAKLIGAPAGYVGYEEGGQLTEAIRKSPSAVLLLDEIEKAHPDIYNVLLQVMDYATLTDNQGRKADFRNVVLIMTSNAGADRLGKNSIGFHTESMNAEVIREVVKNTFQPEFRNRLDRIVVFNGMDDDMAVRVVNKKLRELQMQLARKNIELEVADEAAELIRKLGISVEFGAREVDRVIRNEIKPLLVDEILFGKLSNGGTVRLEAAGGKFVITEGR